MGQMCCLKCQLDHFKETVLHTDDLQMLYQPSQAKVHQTLMNHNMFYPIIQWSQFFSTLQILQYGSPRDL